MQLTQFDDLLWREVVLLGKNLRRFELCPKQVEIHKSKRVESEDIHQCKATPLRERP
jgi:hypothetical protein